MFYERVRSVLLRKIYDCGAGSCTAMSFRVTEFGEIDSNTVSDSIEVRLSYLLEICVSCRPGCAVDSGMSSLVLPVTRTSLMSWHWFDAPSNLLRTRFI
jgi:hypothetical protein